MKVIATNKQAYHNYFIESTYEAGIVLLGAEVKSVRQGSCNLKDTFILIDKNNEMYVKNMYIKPYEKATAFKPNERADRKLLMHKKEIVKLKDKIQVKGFTLVPLKIYFEKDKVKLQIGLCKGKHNYDKKEALKQRDIKLDVERTLKDYLP